MNRFSLRQNCKNRLKAKTRDDTYSNTECDKLRFDYINASINRAFLALKNRSYEQAEQLVQEYHHRWSSVIGSGEVIQEFFSEAAYDLFFQYDFCWPNTISVSDEDLKCFVILYCLYGLDAKRAAQHMQEKTGIELDSVVLHKAMRTIRSIHEILKGKHLSDACKDVAGGLNIYYEIKSVNDGQTCKYCKKLRNQKLWFEDAVIGVNYPPFNHCESGCCRCHTLLKMG